MNNKHHLTFCIEELLDYGVNITDDNALSSQSNLTKLTEMLIEDLYLHRTDEVLSLYKINSETFMADVG